MKNFLRWLRQFLSNSGQPSRPSARNAPVTSLEEQLATLSQLGLSLNPGVTIDDLLVSWDRASYESQPYDLVLIAMGSEVEREPWGRPVCDRVWNFDVECIEDTGSYVAIVERLCRVAGMPNLITDLEDLVDFDQQIAWLKYTIDGRPRHFDIPLDDDWADPQTVSTVMSDIERDGRQFYAKDNGQASVWFYLDPSTAEKLNALTGNALLAGS